MDVKILSGSYGEFSEGDIVRDAPLGLVNIASAGVKNAATGKRVAEIVSDQEKQPDPATLELKELKAKAKELKVEGYGRMNADQLKSAITAAEKEIADAEELKQLKAKAEELKIADFESKSRDELIIAIEAAGGGKGAE